MAYAAAAGLQENGSLQVGETRRGGRRRGPPRVSSSMSALVLSGRLGL